MQMKLTSRTVGDWVEHKLAGSNYLQRWQIYIDYCFLYGYRNSSINDMPKSYNMQPRLESKI